MSPKSIFLWSWLWLALSAWPVMAQTTFGPTGWLVDPAAFHLSVHGQMSCLDCHDPKVFASGHPQAGQVARERRPAFKAETCGQCHQGTLDRVAKNEHGGKKIARGAEAYLNCRACHNPHYYIAPKAVRQGKWRPDRPRKEQCGACHEMRTALPKPAKEATTCLSCHQAPDPKDPQLAEVERKFCLHCHAQGAPAADGKTPLLDRAALARTAHAKVACLTCHPQAARYEHDRQMPGDCLACHPRHDEALTGDLHALVACQACHLPGVSPLRDTRTGWVGWKRPEAKGQISPIHQMVKLGDEVSCRRCHAPGNQVGAAAAVLPAKGVLCLPCHGAGFSVSDTVTALSLIGFVLGLAALKAVWFTGSLAGAAEGLGSKIMAVLAGVFGAVFSARIWPILKALFLDGLLQRRLYKLSPGRWAIHALIFWPFVLRFLWGLSGYLLTWLAPGLDLGFALADKNYPATALFFDLTGALVATGIKLAVFRRFLAARTEKIQGLPRPDWLAYGLLAWIIFLGFLSEGARMALAGYPAGARFAVIGWLFSLPFSGLSGLSQMYVYLWYGHAVLTGLFVVYLPFSQMFHLIMAPVVLAVRAAEPTHPAAAEPHPGSKAEEPK